MDTHDPARTGPAHSPLTPDGPATAAGWAARNGVTLVMVAVGAVLLAYFVIRVDDAFDKLLTGVKVAVGLGFVIFIHELGHFLAAKWCDVHVETFSIGFGPPLLGVCAFKRGETTYKLAWFPLGGYVKMLGEGDDSEGAEEDPRSFKNKSVWQRMVIISAGVVMNILLGAALFVFIFMTHGVKRPAAIIGSTDPGSPAWKMGLRPGSEIKQIGRRHNPSMEDVMMVVMNSRENRALPIVYDTIENGREIRSTNGVVPIRTEDSKRPVIGVYHQPRTTQLLKPTKHRKAPVLNGSQASKATPPLEFGDVVVAASDPNQPERVTALAADPRRPGANQFDHFDLMDRFHRLAGHSVTLRVRHLNGATGDVTLPPAYRQTVGLRFRMGEVIAAREDSPAATGGVRVAGGGEAGDILSAVEVTGADGKPLRFTSSPDAAKGERPLDPVRLPLDLTLWAASKPSSFAVKLTVLRPEGHKGRAPQELTLTWDDSWTWVDDESSSPTSAMALSGLGLAYRVLTVIDFVAPGSPAAEAAGRGLLKVNDQVTTISRKFTFEGKAETHSLDVKEDQGAYLARVLQDPQLVQEVTLTLNKGEKVTLTPVIDETLPETEPGIAFEYDIHIRKAGDLGEALAMGVEKTADTVTSIYQNLRSMATGRVAADQILGPLSIAAVSYSFAGENIYEFILFLALINVNLAVVNFLPIPVLDGGHMVFLIYEKLRGKPPSDQVRFIATIVGLLVILSLMAFGFYADIRRFFF